MDDLPSWHAELRGQPQRRLLYIERRSWYPTGLELHAFVSDTIGSVIDTYRKHMGTGIILEHFLATDAGGRMVGYTDGGSVTEDLSIALHTLEWEIYDLLKVRERDYPLDITLEISKIT